MLKKYFKVLKEKPTIIKKPKSAVRCLKCGTHTLQGERCCAQPIHNVIKY